MQFPFHLKYSFTRALCGVKYSFKIYCYSSRSPKLHLEAENSFFNFKIRKSYLSSLLLSSLCAYKNAPSSISGVISLHPLTEKDHLQLLEIG